MADRLRGMETLFKALADETRVRRAGTKATIGDLKTADEVFVMSKLEGGSTKAYLVVVPRT